MPFEVHPPNADGIIVVRVWGPANLTTGKEARSATVAFVKEHDCRRVLVDFRETRIVAPLHEFMQYYRETATVYPPNTRLALVISESTVPLPDADMEVARVVSLAGGIALRDFRDMNTATSWLLRA